jgi:EAL domain-containing protein (putative c-di-GMP-specific phosphodiesterase class I)
VSTPALLDRLLEPGALTAVFQPVVTVAEGSPRVHYFEGLVRGPQDTNLQRPDVLFAYARRKRAADRVDRACVRTILAAAEALPYDVGINVHASTLASDPGFAGFLADTAWQHGLQPMQLIVEVVEHSAPAHAGAFRDAVAALRDIGVRVALDDVGAGLSNYKMILDCRPTYFKLDGYIVRGAADDQYRQAVLRSIVELARPFGAHVVAEGIESPSDLQAAREAGAELGQGFLLGRPAPAAAFGCAAASDDASNMPEQPLSCEVSRTV